MAACSRRSSKWRSPVTAVSTSNYPRGGSDTGAAGALFSEELGVVLQVKAEHAAAVQSVFVRHGLGDWTHAIGAPTREMRVRRRRRAVPASTNPGKTCGAPGRKLPGACASVRDEPSCAREEFAAACDTGAPGLNVALTFDPNEDVSAPFIDTRAARKVAVLREQGVNSQIEMAAVFERVGFEAARRAHERRALGAREARFDFRGLVACGGFSYGDVLGAGEGWAKSILYHAGAREQFQRFLDRSDTFTLGVCNGCQMFAALKEIIPGAAALAALRAQPRRAVRRALLAGRVAAVAIDLPRRHGRIDAADCRGARRRPRRVRE